MEMSESVGITEGKMMSKRVIFGGGRDDRKGNPCVYVCVYVSWKYGGEEERWHGNKSPCVGDCYRGEMFKDKKGD